MMNTNAVGVAFSMEAGGEADRDGGGGRGIDAVAAVANVVDLHGIT